MAKKAEVVTAAALLIKEHGEDAWLEATSKSTDEKAAGNMASSQFWAHVANAIAEMSEEDAGGTATKH
jgi:hypothetical protein